MHNNSFWSLHLTASLSSDVIHTLTSSHLSSDSYLFTKLLPVLHGSLKTSVLDLVLLTGRFSIPMMNYWEDNCMNSAPRINSFSACTKFSWLVKIFSLILRIGFQIGDKMENFVCLP